MINFLCGNDPVEMGIKDHMGWNISLFLDHLQSCEQCRKGEPVMIERLNKLIGGTEE